MSYGGIQIIEDRNMVDYIEDWSGVRSLGRATRRRKQGHPQRILTKAAPKKEAFSFNGKLVMHPDTANALRTAIRQRGANGSA